jgi:hypothetical protein
VFAARDLSTGDECTEDQRNLGKVVKDSLSVNEFLRHETGSGQHSKASILKLLCLHGEEFFGVFRLQAKRVEVEVSRDVGVTEKTGLADGNILGINPSDGSTLGLSGSDEGGQKDPEHSRDLSKVGDGRARHLGIEEERGSLDLLSDEETNSGEHGNTSVGQFGLAVSLKSGFIGLLGESQRIEKTDRGERSWDIIDSESLEGGSLVVIADRSKGGGRSDKGKEGGSELHGDID